MRRLFVNANYDFINRRRMSYMLSAAALLIFLAAAIFWQMRDGAWLNYGVDFTGGSSVQIQITGTSVSTADIRAVVNRAVPGSTISEFGSGNEFIIRSPGRGDDAATASSDAVVDAVVAQYGEENVTVGQTDAVGATVGNELQTKALIAILVSLAATLIYIAFRFEWRFGVAAVIATVHDILMTLGVLAILHMEISLPTVAAVLTIVGYSLNDTIIIFDRIRENLRTGKRGDFVALLNRSINETLPRTVLTSGTTLVTLLALYLFGGAMIRDFALILIVGILLGTYSSIFIAAPALLEIEKRWPHEQKQLRKPRTTRPGAGAVRP